MEAWILQYSRVYDAGPWPFRQSWDQWLAQPQPLLDAVDDMGCVSPLDGVDETPSVPANLPRALPRGQYELACYHDADHFYIMLAATDAPAVPGLEADDRLIHAAIFLSADGHGVYSFARDDKGALSATVRPYRQGARIKPVPPVELPWDFRMVMHAQRELACWRIPRTSLANVFLGNTLSCSVARVCLRTLEAVAWGSYHIWGVRHDEMGQVRLVAERTLPPVPTLRRVELHYDAATETGQFRIRCKHVYTPAEEVPLGKMTQDVHWGDLALRSNGTHLVVPLASEVETPALPIVEGINTFEAATTGGLLAGVTFTKRSGNRIVEPTLPPVPVTDYRQLRTAILRECDELVAANLARRERGEAMEFRGWRTYTAASVGRAYHYLQQDPRYLDFLRDEADFALSLQREDGTFSGFNSARFGVKPAPWRGGAYDSGPAGDLWCVAAKLLGDAKYLAASGRLLAAYANYRVELNHNFAAFGLYHHAAHYRLTGDRAALDLGRYYCRHTIMNNLLPCGVHSGHNYYTVYSSIILATMTEFAAVLPADDPLKDTLRDRSIRMANELFARMQADGSVDARDRYHIALRLRLFGFLGVAYLTTPDNIKALDRILDRTLQFATPAEPRAFERLTNGNLVRYVAHRTDQLAGRPVDALTIL